MRMRQSLAQIEEAFAEETAADRSRRLELIRNTEQRAVRRDVERRHRHGTVRFVLLALSLVLTAVVVTVIMFRALYILLG